MRAQRPYSPLYFLAALGNGGLAITFFLYLMFLVPHKETPIPTFEALARAVEVGGPTVGPALLAAVLGMLFFAYRFVGIGPLLAKNMRKA